MTRDDKIEAAAVSLIERLVPLPGNHSLVKLAKEEIQEALNWQREEGGG